MIASITNFFANQKNQNYNNINFETCCPNCKYKYNIRLRQTITIEEEEYPISQTVNNNIKQSQLNVNESRKKCIKSDGIYNDIKTTKIISTTPIKKELTEEDLKFSTFKDYTSKSNSEEKILPKYLNNEPKILTDYSNKKKLDKHEKINNFELQPKENCELNQEEFEIYKNYIIDDNIDEIYNYSKNVKPDIKIKNYALEQSTNMNIIELLNKKNSMWDENALSLAIKSGSEDKIKLLLNNFDKKILTDENIDDIYSNAFAFDKIDLLKLLENSNIKIPENIIEIAIRKKAYNIIEYLIKKNYKFTSKCFGEAIELKDIQLLNFLIFNGCEWGEFSDHQKNTILYNEEEIITWLKEHNCPFINM